MLLSIVVSSPYVPYIPYIKLSTLNIHQAIDKAIREVNEMTSENIINSLEACSDGPISYALDFADSEDGKLTTFFIYGYILNTNEHFELLRSYVGMSDEVAYRICEYAKKYTQDSSNDELYLLAA